MSMRSIFNFIHKHAVESYKSELKQLIVLYASLEKGVLADYFIYSVWTRAGLQNEGHFKLPGGEHNLSADLDYSMLDPLQRTVKYFLKRGSVIQANALSIWAYSARGIVSEELQEDLKELWVLIDGTRELWEARLTKLYNDDCASGMDKELADATFRLSKKILSNVPPKKFRSLDFSSGPVVSTLTMDASEFYGLNRLVDDLAGKGATDKKPSFVIFMGGVGAGKTTIRKKQFPDGYVHFEFGEIMMTVRKIVGDTPDLHKYVTVVCEKVLQKSFRERKNIVTEIIGNNESLLEPLIDKLAEIGYGVDLRHITLDPVEGYKRHRQAVMEDPDYISSFHTQETTLSFLYHQLGLGELIVGRE